MTRPEPTSILVVEDDADVRETLVLVLESEGFAVREAREGREALEVMRAGFRPDLILLDLMMPVMNGWEFRAEMKRDPELAAIPVVFVSALEPAPERATALDAAGFLHKPFDLAALLRTVQRVTERSAVPA